MRYVHEHTKQMREALLLKLRRKKYSSESDVREAIRWIFQSFPNLKFHPVAQNAYSEVGVSDYVACFRGYYIAVEAKYSDNTPSGPQETFLNAIADAGGLSICVWETNLEQLLECLDYVATLPYAGREDSTLGSFFLGLSHYSNSRSSYLRD